MFSISRFISAGPDQRRTESSDSHGNVRGSYTFLDDKGVQRYKENNYIIGINVALLCPTDIFNKT